MIQKHLSPHIPVSWGELIDKITILEIKAQRLEDRVARANVSKELASLREIAGPVFADDSGVQSLAVQLKSQNEALWEVEDQIRDKERTGEFDASFIALARSVYQHNDRRGALKREISLVLASDLIEEKSYKPY